MKLNQKMKSISAQRKQKKKYMHNIYKFISYCLIPFIYLNTLFRLFRKKEDFKRYKERFGFTNLDEIKNNSDVKNINLFLKIKEGLIDFDKTFFSWKDHANFILEDTTKSDTDTTNT